MNICFIMYPWERVEDHDSTLRLIHEAVVRKHTVAITTPGGLTIRDSITSAFCKVIQKVEKVPSSPKTFKKNVKFKNQLLPIAGFDVVFMRDNPPLDSIMLNFLDSVRHDAFFINDIQGLREANNKLYTATFHDPNNEIIPATHVSKNKEYLKKVIMESPNERMIMKPLNGFGGSGVIVVEKNATHNISSLLDFYIDGQKGMGTTGSNYVILQEFVEGAEEGDIRVIMLNGEAVGCFRRRPPSGDHRSNISAGGTYEKHTLTKQEKKICAKIGKRLVQDGLYLVGLDIINGRLIEVNVCSPGGITAINRLYRTKLQTKILDFAEGVVRQKESAIERKQALRKTIEEA